MVIWWWRAEEPAQDPHERQDAANGTFGQGQDGEEVTVADGIDDEFVLTQDQQDEGAGDAGEDHCGDGGGPAEEERHDIVGHGHWNQTHQPVGESGAQQEAQYRGHGPA